MKGILSELSVIFTPVRSPITRQTDKEMESVRLLLRPAAVSQTGWDSKAL